MENEIVHFHVYDPSGPQLFKSSKNDRAAAYFVSCSNKNKCELFKNGFCVFRQPLSGDNCPYGKSWIEEGYTKRASKFYSWIRIIKEKYKNSPSLTYPPKNIYEVGEYIYLPYSYIAMNEGIPFLKHEMGFVSGNRFLLKENFNITSIRGIINFRPRAMMGGEISNYRNETLPKFLKHLSEKYNELYIEIISESDTAKHIAAKFTNVGRNAYLKTIAIGSKFDKDGHAFIWNGEYLLCQNSEFWIYSPVKKYDHVEAKIYPSEKSVIKITDESQVDEDTVFID